MDVIVDRFEGDFAIVELPDKTMVNMDKRLLPGAKEGDVVGIIISKKNTEQRKEKIKKIADRLWES